MSLFPKQMHNTPDQKVVEREFTISKTIGFEAAHFLPSPDNPTDYKSVHGHSFQLTVELKGTRAASCPWLMDFGLLNKHLESIKNTLDHNLLNDVEDLTNPTLENLCAWVADRLNSSLPQLSRVTIARPSLGETCSLCLA